MPYRSTIRLLLVDDDEVDRLAVRRALDGTGLTVEVSEAGDAETATALLQARPFDCVLMDYHLPGTDGLRLLRSLRSAGVNCPVITLTGRGDEQIAVELMKAGAADYLSKQNLNAERLGSSLRYAISIARAEHERRQILGREKSAREEAEAANRAKDEFLATLSHELRTPLNAILGWSRLIASGNLDQATLRRAVETIERNGRLQAQLIEDLLDISRIITGKLKLTMRFVRLVPLLEAAVETIRPAAEAKGIALDVDTTAAPAYIHCDPARVQQIIWNLLSNAVKFTPAGGTIRLHATDAQGSVAIAVQDSGMGIRPEFLPHVFERFRQQDSATTRAHGGLGIGLAIVKHLAELHGGGVNVESGGEGAGATFTVLLPVVAPAEPEPEPARQEPQVRDGGPRLDGVRVLLVDSEEDSRMLAAAVLEEAGAQVTSVETAQEASGLVSQMAPDVIVADLGSPLGEAPAAAIVPSESVEDRTRALLAGYLTCLPRPVDSRELTAVVAALARRTRKETGVHGEGPGQRFRTKVPGP